MLFFTTFTGFHCKRHFHKRLKNALLRRFCRLFLPCLWIEIYGSNIYAVDTYTRGDDCVIIYPKDKHTHALFHNPSAIRKWYCRGASDSELADIDILRNCRQQGFHAKKGIRIIHCDIWIIHGGTRKITMCSSTFYGVTSNFCCHTVKCTVTHCNFSSATMNYSNAVFCVFVKKKCLVDRGKKASNCISIISNDVSVFQLLQF